MSSIVLLEQNVFELIAPFAYCAEQCIALCIIIFSFMCLQNPNLTSNRRCQFEVV